MDEGWKSELILWVVLGVGCCVVFWIARIDEQRQEEREEIRLQEKACIEKYEDTIKQLECRVLVRELR